MLSGNHRLRLLQEMGVTEAPVVVVDLDDARARVLAQTLNRTRGTRDDTDAYAKLLDDVLGSMQGSEVAELLPETEASIDRILQELGGDSDPDAVPPAPARPKSKLGELYELGPHRLMCGDATNPEQVALLLAGAEPIVMATDPPYGVGVDHRWREPAGLTTFGQARGSIANDDRVDWSAAFTLTNASVAYVWHGGLHAAEAWMALERTGFEIRAQIIWAKRVAAISRGAYHWQHEPCYYAVRKGCAAGWRGGRQQTTIWESGSPIAAFGRTDDDARTRHPTQKPVDLFKRPILNHTRPGEAIFDPFCGSGTAVIAAELTGRVCFAMEIDRAYCDVIRRRYELFVAGGG